MHIKHKTNFKSSFKVTFGNFKKVTFLWPKFIKVLMKCCAVAGGMNLRYMLHDTLIQYSMAIRYWLCYVCVYSVIVINYLYIIWDCSQTTSKPKISIGLLLQIWIKCTWVWVCSENVFSIWGWFFYSLRLKREQRTKIERREKHEIIRYLYLAGDGGGLEEGGGPGPLRHDGGGRQTDGYLAAGIKSSVQVVCVMVNVLPNLRKRGLMFCQYGNVQSH